MHRLDLELCFVAFLAFLDVDSIKHWLCGGTLAAVKFARCPGSPSAHVLMVRMSVASLDAVLLDK